MTDRIDFRAEGEAFGANYADGLMLTLRRDLTDEEAKVIALAYQRHLFDKSLELAREGVDQGDLDKWFKGGMTGFHRRLSELQSAASLADRGPSRPQ